MGASKTNNHIRIEGSKPQSGTAIILQSFNQDLKDMDVLCCLESIWRDKIQTEVNK